MKGAESLLNRLNKIKDAVETGVPGIIEEKVNSATIDAQNGFIDAKYDGMNDVVVSVESSEVNGSHEWNITASGETVMFIEFGTGIKFAHNNPWEMYEPASWSAEHAGWLVPPTVNKWKGWWPLPHGIVGGGGAFTQGNPSNNVMYNTAKKLKTTLPTEAKKAFR